MVEEGTVAVVGDVIVKIDAPYAEDMQFKVMMMIHHLRRTCERGSASRASTCSYSN
ncbi:hypothetical protein ACVXZ0_01855 [Staphylococcus aureus]